ncbi:iron donor protein CyaY [Candidatus Gillettellia adelgis]
MNNRKFYHLVDQLILNIEETLDNFSGNVDIDYETHGSTMTISVKNGRKIIINSQEARHQIWLATNMNGYHFNYCEGRWLCDRTDQSFYCVLSKAVSMQVGKSITFS